MFPSKANSVKKAIDVMKPCKVTYTTNSVYIENQYQSLYLSNSGTVLKGAELAYIKQFRSYFVKNKDIKYNKKYATFKPQYFKFFQEDGLYHDIVEIDINRAYPSAGRILKIIPDELYEKGLALSKLAMLISIGSLKRTKKVIKVDGKGRRELVSMEKPAEWMEKIWRSIVGYVDYSMQKAVKSKSDSVYFYWCDALFVKREDEKHFIEQLKSFGFECKTKEIDKIQYTDDKALVYYKDVPDPKEFTRPFRTLTVDSLETVRKRYEQKTK